MHKLTGIASLLLLLGGPAMAEPTPSTAVRDGEALFTTGARPGQAAPRATMANGDAMPATALPCAGCHGTDGAGRRGEAGVTPPPVAWSALSRAMPGRPAYDEPTALRAVVQGIGAGGRPLDPVMPRYGLTIEDGRNLVAFLRSLDTRPVPGVEENLVRIGLLLPPGPAGEAFATAFEAALATSAPDGVFGRRAAVVRATVPNPREAGAVARRLLQDDVLALASALPGEAGSVAAAAAAEARVPVLNARATASPPPLSFALLPGVVEEGTALLSGLSNPGRALLVAGTPDARHLAEAIAERIGQISDDEPRVVTPSGLAEAVTDASGVLLLTPAAALAGMPFLRELTVPVLLPAAVGGAEAPALAAALERPVRLGIGIPLGGSGGAAADRFAASAARGAGMPGRLGHAAGEVFAEALRRAGRNVTRERIAAVFGAPETFEPGSLPGLRLAGGARVGSVEVWTAEVDGAGRVLGGPRSGVTAGN
ncbi:MAG TPA: c-type cytochrome [Roseomonas sp.]|jgi:hypothetical protein